jgi:hypothetical protein
MPFFILNNIECSTVLNIKKNPMKTQLQKNCGQPYAPVKTVFAYVAMLSIFFAFQTQRAIAQFGNNPCMGASTTKLTLNSTNATLLSGTAGTVGVKYRFANAYNSGTSTTSIDVIAELMAIQYGTVFNATRYNFTYDQIGNPPSGTGFGIDGNFQPSFISTGTTYPQPANTNENLFSTWKFSFVLNSNNSTPVYLPIIAQVIDNDGVTAAANASGVRESISSITNPTSTTTASVTQQTYTAATKTFLGPAINQAGIGTGTDYIGYFYYNNVSTVTLKFNHNIFVGTADITPAGSGSSRYSSVHFGCDYTGDQNFVLQNISGNVYNDGNGDNTISGVGTNGSSTLYAILYDNTTGNVLATSTVSAGGAYSFAGITPGDDYTVYLSTTAATAGQTAIPTLTPPAGYGYGGEFFGTGAGTDGTPNGILPLGVVNATATNANFAIDQIPVANNYTMTAQANPGGTTTVKVPVAAFTGNDPEDGVYATGLSGKKVTLNAATNGTLFYNGVAVSTSTTITNFDPSLVTIDPAGATATAVTPTFTYAVFDAAGVSSLPKTITMPLGVPAVISGSIFDDTNGDAAITAGENFTNAGGLNAVLTDAAGNVIETVAVNAGGLYSFSNSTISTGYKIVLSTTTPLLGTVLTTSSLPNPVSGTWVNTGVNPGGATPTPGNTTGILSVTTPSTGSLINQNFGIEQIPVANNFTATAQVNPGGTGTVVVPSAAFTGTDAEDGAYTAGLSGKKVTLNPATNGTLYYNGVAVSSSTTITGFNPALVTLDPAGATQTGVTPTFTYSVFDAANQPSAAKTISLPFAAPIILSGNVFDDSNGDASKAAGEAFTNAGGLFAVLTDASGNVIESVAVTAGGAYTFTKAINSQNYNVILSTTAPGATLLTSSLPNPASGTWVNTGVNPGGATPTPGNTTGIITLTTPVTGDLLNQNFAIEQIPVANNYTAAAQANPGGTATVNVPAAAFSATDTEDGAYTAGLSGKKVTLNPATNGTLYYNGVAVNSSTTITGFNPALVTIDPTGAGTGAITPTFTFSVFDAANQPSVPKTISIPLGVPTTISGNVFNDANGNAVQNAGENGTNAGGLNAVLTDAAGNVIETVPVSAGGVYTFTKATASTNYNVVLSTTTPVTGSVLTASSLPNPASGTWVNTGVNPGGATPTTGNTTGILAVTTPASGNVSNQNFAIEQTPAVTNFTATAQANPGGTATVRVAAAAFTGNDATDGAYTPGLSGRKVTLNAATNGTLYYNGVAVSSSTTITNFDPSLVTIDPAGAGTGAITPTFTYSVFDAADKPSAPATISMAFGPGIVLSGTIFDDANGNATQNAGENGTNAGGLFAVLTDVSGNVIESVAVSATGTYTFASATSSAAYNVILSTTSPATGNKLTTSSLPTPVNGNWSSTGVNPGGSTPTTSNKTGILTVNTPAAGNVTAQNFAIEQLPISNTQSYNIATPTGNSFLTLNGTGAAGSPGPLTGSDAEDQPASGSLSTKNIQITMLPTNGNELWYNGAKISFGADGTTAPSVTNPLTIANYNPSLLQIKFTGTGSSSTTFNYSYVDAAGKPSGVAAGYTVSWLGVLPVTVRSFNAEENDGAGYIRWSVENEIGTNNYIVERSTNGIDFNDRGTVTALNNAALNSYLYKDALTDVTATAVYYRLRIQSNSGTIKYSSIVKIQRNAGIKKSISITANPINESSQLKITTDVNANAGLSIYGTNGQLVYKTERKVYTGVNNVSLNMLTTLNKGVYVISVIINGEKFNTKVVL